MIFATFLLTRDRSWDYYDNSFLTFLSIFALYEMKASKIMSEKMVSNFKDGKSQMGYGQIRDIPEYIKPYFDEASQFRHYYEYEKSSRLRRDIEDRFICLKGFSSSTPVVNSAAFGRECLGGGFYFRYKGHGIAVDPGIGFTSLMHRNSIFIDD